MDQFVRRYKFKERRKEQCFNREPYGLSHEKWNDALKSEFDAYRQWCIQAFNPKRPRRMRQRPTTFDKSIQHFENYFGYLVNVRESKIEKADLRLAYVADPQLVGEYIAWHVQHRTNGPSRYMEQMIGLFIRMAHYYLPDVTPAAWDKLAELRQTLDPGLKRDKRDNWNSLATIERIGLAEYPGTGALAQASTDRERLLLALRAQRSLILRLLVRRPLRSRNIRELKVDRNLFNSNGQWIVEFRGEELKVARLQGQQNIYRVSFPPDLVSRLEEFLTLWRPLLPGHNRPELFTVWTKRPFTANALNTEVKKAIFSYTGRATNIHRLRDIWATEFIEQTQDFPLAASMLGDTVETVLRHYMHLRRTNTCEVADRFFAQQVADSSC